mmetsp:Transcript_25324/g.59687  ORF Transcript_25324/g.59687 Transcript_25324/m.59687 type:complete len:267 (-) Transcript_25324:310-1110(-)
MNSTLTVSIFDDFGETVRDDGTFFPICIPPIITRQSCLDFSEFHPHAIDLDHSFLSDDATQNCEAAIVGIDVSPVTGPIMVYSVFRSVILAVLGFAIKYLGNEFPLQFWPIQIACARVDLIAKQDDFSLHSCFFDFHETVALDFFLANLHPCSFQHVSNALSRSQRQRQRIPKHLSASLVHTSLRYPIRRQQSAGRGGRGGIPAILLLVTRATRPSLHDAFGYGFSTESNSLQARKLVLDGGAWIAGTMQQGQTPEGGRAEDVCDC